MKKASSIVSSSILMATALFLTRVEKVSAFAWGPTTGTRPWAGTCVSDGVATIQGLECLLANILSVAITVIGLAAFIMFIFGAFQYMISGGNAKDTEGARKTITYAIIGLVVALSAYIILNLISDFTGVDAIRQFVIPSS